MAGPVVVALFITCFTVQAFEIPTGSMGPALLVGDHVLVDRTDVGPQSGSLPLLPSFPSPNQNVATSWFFFRPLSPACVWSSASSVLPEIVSD